jgi:hypothetical protein
LNAVKWLQAHKVTVALLPGDTVQPNVDQAFPLAFQKRHDGVKPLDASVAVGIDGCAILMMMGWDKFETTSSAPDLPEDKVENIDKDTIGESVDPPFVRLSAKVKMLSVNVIMLISRDAGASDAFPYISANIVVGNRNVLTAALAEVEDPLPVEVDDTPALPIWAF